MGENGILTGGIAVKGSVKHLGPHRRPVTEFRDAVPKAELLRIEGKLDDALRIIGELREELELVRKELRNPVSAPRPKPRFFIEFNDKVIERETAAETMADFLEAVGLERVARLGMRIAKLPLVSHDEPPKDRGSCRRRGWVVVTHASNADKKAILEQIVDELGLRARIRIMQPIASPVDHAEAAE
jgi:hypothetical protein